MSRTLSRSMIEYLMRRNGLATTQRRLIDAFRVGYTSGRDGAPNVPPEDYDPPRKNYFDRGYKAATRKNRQSRRK